MTSSSARRPREIGQRQADPARRRVRGHPGPGPRQNVETRANHFSHLVIELKRPHHKLTDDDVTQLRSYASAITNDERFDQPNVDWEFWLTGNDTTRSVDEAREQHGVPHGVVQHASVAGRACASGPGAVENCPYSHRPTTSLEMMKRHIAAVRELQSRRRSGCLRPRPDVRCCTGGLRLDRKPPSHSGSRARKVSRVKQERWRRRRPARQKPAP